MGLGFPVGRACGWANVEHSSRIGSAAVGRKTHLNIAPSVSAGTPLPGMPEDALELFLQNRPRADAWGYIQVHSPQQRRNGKLTAPRDLALFQPTQAKVRFLFVAQRDLIHRQVALLYDIAPIV